MAPKNRWIRFAGHLCGRLKNWLQSQSPCRIISPVARFVRPQTQKTVTTTGTELFPPFVTVSSKRRRRRRRQTISMDNDWLADWLCPATRPAGSVRLDWIVKRRIFALICFALDPVVGFLGRFLCPRPPLGLSCGGGEGSISALWVQWSPSAILWDLLCSAKVFMMQTYILFSPMSFRLLRRCWLNGWTISGCFDCCPYYRNEYCPPPTRMGIDNYLLSQWVLFGPPLSSCCRHVSVLPVFITLKIHNEFSSVTLQNNRGDEEFHRVPPMQRE